VKNIPAADPGAGGSFGIVKLGRSASPSDLCRLMAYFADKEDSKALELMAMAPGAAVPRKDFFYAGGKAGSEPGVLSMTLLLKNRNSRQFCLSASWNDELHAPSAEKFSALVQAAVSALAAAK
jgi:hypothetical protein